VRRLLAIALSLACLQTPGQSVRPAKELSAELDAIFAPFAERGAPGFAALVRLGGKTIFEGGYGVRDQRTLTPIDRHTNFRLASFSKQFTAMAVMLLVHDGQLHYDDRLSALLPGLPGYARNITVRQLLNHTSGVPDYEQLMEEAKKNGGPTWTATRQISDTEVLTLLQQHPQADFQAGGRWSYSNSGYVLLGLIVAKVSGEPFGEFLQRRIFQPLHMNNTLAFEADRNTVAHRAYGHVKQDGEYVEADQSSTSATLGDGGIYSNLDDLSRWDSALRHHTLLSEAEMRPAVTPAVLNDGTQTRWPTTPGEDNLNPGHKVAYGFGWFLDPYQGRPRMSHTGTTRGFRTVIQRFTTDDVTVIVLANRTDLDPAALSLRAADLCLEAISSSR